MRRHTPSVLSAQGRFSNLRKYDGRVGTIVVSDTPLDPFVRIDFGEKHKLVSATCMVGQYRQGDRCVAVVTDQRGVLARLSDYRPGSRSSVNVQVFTEVAYRERYGDVAADRFFGEAPSAAGRDEAPNAAREQAPKLHELLGLPVNANRSEVTFAICRLTREEAVRLLKVLDEAIDESTIQAEQYSYFDYNHVRAERLGRQFGHSHLDVPTGAVYMLTSRAGVAPLRGMNYEAILQALKSLAPSAAAHLLQLAQRYEARKPPGRGGGAQWVLGIESAITSNQLNTILGVMRERASSTDLSEASFLKPEEMWNALAVQCGATDLVGFFGLPQARTRLAARLRDMNRNDPHWRACIAGAGLSELVESNETASYTSNIWKQCAPLYLRTRFHVQHAVNLPNFINNLSRYEALQLLEDLNDRVPEDRWRDGMIERLLLQAARHEGIGIPSGYVIPLQDHPELVFLPLLHERAGVHDLAGLTAEEMAIAIQDLDPRLARQMNESTVDSLIDPIGWVHIWSADKARYRKISHLLDERAEQKAVPSLVDLSADRLKPRDAFAELAHKIGRSGLAHGFGLASTRRLVVVEALASSQAESLIKPLLRAAGLSAIARDPEVVAEAKAKRCWRSLTMQLGLAHQESNQFIQSARRGVAVELCAVSPDESLNNLAKGCGIFELTQQPGVQADAAKRVAWRNLVNLLDLPHLRNSWHVEAARKEVAVAALRSNKDVRVLMHQAGIEHLARHDSQVRSVARGRGAEIPR